MPVSDPMVMPLAIELLECFEQEIAKVAAPPRLMQIRTGDVVVADISQNHNECCAGLGWVRPVTFYPSSGAFPVQDEAPGRLGVTAWVVTLELGVLRCAPTPGPDEVITGQQHFDLAQAVMDDAAAMRRAICCWIEATGNASTRRQRILSGQWQPLPTEGGCAGGVLPVLVRRGECDCDEAGPEY